VKNSFLDSSSALLEPQPKYFTDRPRSESVASEAHERPGALLPGENLAELLGIADTAPLQEILNAVLFKPIAELANNRGKRIRAQLVSLCHRLVDDAPTPSLLKAKQSKLAAEVVELIHLGSLVVDDIEDGSPMRRGRPALHVQYGIPLALNAGNWLYFWPAELLKRMELPAQTLPLVYEYYHRTLLRAHFGQAADLGAAVDRMAQASVAPTCQASLALKTGALMGFAATLGGVVANASVKVLAVLDIFGRDLGVALQMFDDMGNVIGRCEPAKRYEDLLMKRPSWVWACAANLSPAREYKKFITAVGRLPDPRELETWLAEHDLIDHVRKSARGYLNAAFLRLENSLRKEFPNWSRGACDELRQLGEEIARAYE
jgi:geranylgeranyl pyrophosphate synthase